jgi:hypothetical protein
LEFVLYDVGELSENSIRTAKCLNVFRREKYEKLITNGHDFISFKLLKCEVRFKIINLNLQRTVLLLQQFQTYDIRQF